MAKCWRLELDYDQLTREDVEQDAKRLIEKYPALGDQYRIEASKTGEGHWHLIFQKSLFTSFQEAYDIALQSQADPDWLDLCEQYECFGLETEQSRQANEVRRQKPENTIVNKPVRKISSAVILDLKAATPLDARRIVKICEVIKDKTWEYTSFTEVQSLEQHVQIGCQDEAQANRRLKWLSDQNLNFTGKVEHSSIST